MTEFEKQILDKLTGIESDIKELKTDMKDVKSDIARIESKVDNIEVTVGGIQVQTMELCESAGITEEKMKSIKEIIADNEIEIKTIRRKFQIG